MPWRVYVTASLLAYKTILQSKKVYVTISVIYNTILQPWRVYVTVSMTYKTILHTLSACINACLTTHNLEALTKRG